MKRIKNIILVLMFMVFLSVLELPVNAANPIEFAIELSASEVEVGEQVEVVVSLEGYTEEAATTDAIRGLQVDITGVDSSVLSVMEYTSLIDDNTAVSNTASYNTANKRVRLAYVQMNGTLSAPCKDVLKVVFQVNPDLTEAGSIKLPVTVKMQTVSKQITLTGECKINYSTETSNVTSIDIIWGAMEFEYTDGIWNTKTHRYEGSGWVDNGSGFVTVKNKGNSATSAFVSYSTERSDITGQFSNGSSTIDGKVNVLSGDEMTVYLSLDGKPEDILNNAKIGTVTIKIGGE